MAAEIARIPCLEDNYAWVLHEPHSGRTVCVDVPDAAPIIAELQARGWALTDIWLTHHHPDHIQGVADLVAATGAKVTGARADAHRLPALDQSVAPGEHFAFGPWPVEVLDAPGHTVGHIAFYVAGAKAAFTGDSLMALGCGRLFEGSPAQMFATLTRLAALPGDTWIYSGHEYSQSNARFALSLDPDNAALQARAAAIAEARSRGEPTLPVTLSLELATNPYLRPHDPALRAKLGMAEQDDLAVFTEIRARKDRF